MLMVAEEQMRTVGEVITARFRQRLEVVGWVTLSTFTGPENARAIFPGWLGSRVVSDC